MNRSPPLTPNDKFSIFTRLERDISPYFACKSSNLLHRYDGSESFGLSGFYPERTCHLPCVQYCPTPKHWFSIWGTWVIHPCFCFCIPKMSFLHLKLAMKRFYYGPEARISTGSLSHTQVTEHRQWPTRTEVIWLFSREAQICTKPLGLDLRIQDILLFPEWRNLIDKPYATYTDPLVLCPHNKNVRQIITPIMRSHNTREKGFLDNSLICVACNVCSTVCDIELCEIDSKKAFVITRWLNLGLVSTKRTHYGRLTPTRLVCPVYIVDLIHITPLRHSVPGVALKRQRVIDHSRTYAFAIFPISETSSTKGSCAMHTNETPGTTHSENLPLTESLISGGPYKIFWAAFQVQDWTKNTQSNL